MEAEVEHQQPLDIQSVYAAITGAFSLQAPVRTAAEASLKSWEADAVPGFLAALLNIFEHSNDEAIRLLAAVVAKNAVGSSWRKTLGTREWSRVPPEEKAGFRTASLRLLLSEASGRVAVQLGLLITNIARFDFPGEWETLLADLTQAAAWGNAATSVDQKGRALFTLKNTLRALRSKRIVVETARPVGSMSPQDLKPMAERIAAERLAMNERVRATFHPAAAEWRGHFAAAAQGAAAWAERGRLANRGLHVLRELLLLLPDWDGLLPEVGQFLEAVHQASAATVTMLVPGSSEQPAAADGERAAVAAKSFERALQCVLAALDKQPIAFARFLPVFLSFYGHAALVALDAAALQHVRAKTRVLLTRFLARVLLCPYYTRAWLNGRAAREDADSAEAQAMREALPKAVAAVDDMLSAERCAVLVEAVVTKYIALSPEELQEWQDNPEGYVRSMDVESSPDADTPRPCGLALLICMLERSPDNVAGALIALAAKLQAQAPSLEAVLARESVYRAIGEGYFRPAVAAQVNFPAWYQSELADFLQGGAEQSAVTGRSVLVARAAWLMGVCGGDLPPQLWATALAALTAHAGAADLVLALTAVSAIMSLCTTLLEQQQAIKQAQETKKDGKDARIGLLFLSKRNTAAEDPAFIQDHEARVASLAAGAGPLFGALFALLGRLEEAESKVRVLQLVSVAVEVLGDAAQPHLGAVASALPQVWSATADAAAAESGALSRLHSALIAVVTHVVKRLCGSALADAQFQSVLWPLLGAALDVGSVERETLVEEGMQLLSTVLSCARELPPQLPALLPAVFAVLQRGRDNAAVYSALEAYALLGGAELLLPFQRQVFDGLARSMTALASELTVACEPPQPPKPGQKGGLLSREAVQEALAACSLVTVLVQLMSDAALQPLEPTFRAMAAAVCAPVMSAEDTPQALVTIAEGLLEVLARLLLARPAALPPLLPPADPDAAGRFFDAWLAVALTRYLEEILGVPAMAAMGRLRRRSSAAALCALICSGAAPALTDNTGRLARVFALSLRSIGESAAFQEDRGDIRQTIAEMQASPSEREALLLRRAVLAEAAPVLSLNLPAALRAAFAAAAQHHSETALIEAVGWIDGSLEASLRAAIGQNNHQQQLLQ